MSQMISVRVDVTKIDKAKLYKGAKGTYLDIVLMPSRDSKFGDDFMVVQSISKEDRAAGQRGAILGNAKFLRQKQPTQRKAAPASEPLAGDGPPEADDVPF